MLKWLVWRENNVSELERENDLNGKYRWKENKAESIKQTQKDWNRNNVCMSSIHIYHNTLNFINHPRKSMQNLFFK